MFYYMTVNLENGHVSYYKDIASISKEFNLSSGAIISAIRHRHLISKNGGYVNVCWVSHISPDW